MKTFHCTFYKYSPFCDAYVCVALKILLYQRWRHKSHSGISVEENSNCVIFYIILSKLCRKYILNPLLQAFKLKFLLEAHI